MERKLAAIFSTDVKSYSRLMGEDEVATIHTLTAYRTLIATLIQQHRGRVVDSPGDNLLAEFPSVVQAVECAVAIQRELRVRNAGLPLHRRMEFRIGINLGDVIVEGERIYGDGVNIPARLEGLAEAGGLCISGSVYEQVKTRLALGYEDLGAQAVKNIAEPVRVYRVQLDSRAAVPLVREQDERAVGEAGRLLPQEGSAARRVRAWSWWKGALALVGLLLLLGGGVTVWQRSVRPSAPARLVPAAQAPTVTVPETPSIVVLPFVNLSGDPEQEYFSDGITEDLTSRLSKFSGLSVISRNSAFTFKGKVVKVQEVSKELGVQYVLEGSVRKAGDQVRITAQLIDATTDHHLWAERYDRPLTDIFALQDALVQKMVTTLQLQLSLREQGVLARRPQENLEAYDAFLRGLAYFYRLTKEGNAQARQLFEHAIALDPAYAEAYAFLGLNYRLEWLSQWSQGPQAWERAFELAHKALALDDTLPWAYGLLSWIYADKQQLEQALTAAERAIALEPSHADSYVVQSDILNRVGRPEEALKSVEKAMRLNPRYPAWYLNNLSLAYLMTGRYAEAIPVLNTRLLRDPQALNAYRNLANAYRQQWAAQLSQDPQTLAQALAAVQRALVLQDNSSDSHRTLGYIYLWQQQYEQALAEMERAIALDPDEARGRAAYEYAGLAEVLSRMGRSEEALGAAEKALRLKPSLVDLHLANVGMAYALAGRPEQALAPLQRYLSRYPKILYAHLTLAAVYSELGREAEARAEATEVLRLNLKFSLEVHRQREPLKDPARLERHLAALRRAGLW
jgi:TolB-like protein/class 3 adenylate cyclase/predicted Zn-dependent protease